MYCERFNAIFLYRKYNYTFCTQKDYGCVDEDFCKIILDCILMASTLVELLQ